MLDPVQQGFAEKYLKNNSNLAVQDMKHLLLKHGFNDNECMVFLGALLSLVKSQLN